MVLAPSLSGFCWIQSPSGSTSPEHFLLGMRGELIQALLIYYFSQFCFEFYMCPCSQMYQCKSACWRFCLVGLVLSFLWVKHLLLTFYSHISSPILVVLLDFCLLLPLSFWWNFQEEGVINIYVKAAMLTGTPRPLFFKYFFISLCSILDNLFRSMPSLG